MRAYDFFVCGPKFTIIFRSTWEKLLLITYTFPIFDMWIPFGDIRDQIRKLSEIAPNFGRFLPLPNYRGRAFQKLYPILQLSPKLWELTR